MNLHNVDGVIIPFDPSWKNIAISLSGGADSALLAYILSNLVKTQTIHIISHTRAWKTKPWQKQDSQNVYEYLIKSFPNIRFVLHTGFIAPELEYATMGAILTDEYGKKVSGDNIQQRSYAEYICHTYDIDAYYNAVTRNPKGVDLGGMKERDIDPTDDNKHLLMMQHIGHWALHPFRFTDKSWVVKQYKDNNIMELFNITRSCEGDFTGIDYTTYTPGQVVPTCGNCFWCKERAWAIEQNK